MRVVFDDVHCSKVTDLRPGDSVAFWGYRSDGQTHVWERQSSPNNFILEGPTDTSPNADCGNWAEVEGKEEDPEDEPIPIDSADFMILIGGGLLLLLLLSFCCCLCCCLCKRRREKEEKK